MVLANTATAVGLDELAALSEARERAGDLVGAAKTSWAASHMKGIDQSIFGDLVFRTTDLLEVADSAEAPNGKERERDCRRARGRAIWRRRRAAQLRHVLMAFATASVVARTLFPAFR